MLNYLLQPVIDGCLQLHLSSENKLKTKPATFSTLPCRAILWGSVYLYFVMKSKFIESLGGINKRFARLKK
jgi:hypothetical protein